MCILHVQYNLPSLHWVIWIIFGTFRWIYHAKSVYDVAYSFIPLRIGRSLEIVTSFLRVNAEFQLQGWENRWIHNAKDKWNTYKTSSTMFSPCGNTSPPTIVVIFHYFPVSFGVLTILRYLHQLLPGNPDPGMLSSRPSGYELMDHVSLLVSVIHILILS